MLFRSNALCTVWDIPKERRPGFPLSIGWSMALVFSIGIGFVTTTFLSGVAAGAGHLLTGAGATIGAVLVSLVLNVGMFWLGFRLATFLRVPWRDLRTGAAIAAVCWQILQVAGGYVVSHQLHRASELYGTFGIVLGLIAWLYLQSEVTLYAAEVDVVLKRRLWPRSILPATMADPDEPAAGAADEPAGETGNRAGGTEPAAGEDRPHPLAVPVPRGHDERAAGVAPSGAAGWLSRARRVVGKR